MIFSLLPEYRIGHEIRKWHSLPLTDIVHQQFHKSLHQCIIFQTARIPINSFYILSPFVFSSENAYSFRFLFVSANGMNFAICKFFLCQCPDSISKSGIKCSVYISIPVQISSGNSCHGCSLYCHSSGPSASISSLLIILFSTAINHFNSILTRS